ncbi:MAG TPA: hypothetical protein DEA43_00340 [Candidatus Moranbacteria bacterium]|nr:hypothetical protein [Candidatus Moranbacteria bacterium]HBT45320.1 hypothetical protein [Candidatus Moranbacteria bacterium]
MTSENNQRIAVLILGYNDENNLIEAIDSSLNQTYENFNVIYIDNASTDASLSIVKKNYPNLETIAYEKNLGYAGAYAKVLKETFKKNYDAAVLLNSDVIVDKNWLKELVASAYVSEEIAIAQPKIFLAGENKDLANTFGNKINYLGFGFCGHYKKTDSDEFNNDQEIVSASGASLLVKKEAYEKIGGLDEKFFAYLEDQDLSWRAQMLGYKIMLSAKSKMWHKYVFAKNARNNWKFFTLERNRLYFLFKNYSAKTLFLLAPMFFVMEIGILADSLSKGYFFDKIRSYKAFLSNFGQIYRSRQIVQQCRQLPDSELFKKLNPTVEFEEINSPALRLANILLKTYYNLIKPFI